MTFEQQKQLDDILEIVTFVRDNAVNKADFEELKNDVNGMKQEIGGIKQEIQHIKSTMVTKDYLDDKLADLRGDLILLLRKEDVKLKELITILCMKNVIDEKNKKILFSLEPFPQLTL